MKQRCVVWGSREYGQQLAKIAEGAGYKVVAFCNSWKASQQEQINGLPVISPEEVKNLWYEQKLEAVLLGIANPKYIKEVEDIIAREFPQEIPIIPPEGIEVHYLKEEKSRLKYRWEIPFEDQLTIWLQNIMSEVKFWVSIAKDQPNVNQQIMNNENFLGTRPKERPEWRAVAEDLHAQSIVMDIGCGLLPVFGDRLPNGERIQLIRVDPLAPFYNQINRKCMGKYYKKCYFGFFEFIANFYPENYSDLILILNALDHCINPYKSIVECLYILKNGGKLCLEHRRAEGSFEMYQGLHKWNIDYNDQNELIFWNEKNAINVTEKLQKIADIKVQPVTDELPRRSQWLYCEVKKKSDFQLDEFFDMSKEREDLATMVTALMTWIADHEVSYLEEVPKKSNTDI